jgi:RecA-family ATPase
MINEKTVTLDAILAEQEQLFKEQSDEEDSLFTSAEDLYNMGIEEIPCLIEPFLHKVGLACIAGTSDTGKSCFLRQLCMCIISGKSTFLGFSINAKHNRAIYVSTEDDSTATAFCIRKHNKDLQIDSTKLNGLKFIWETENLLRNIDNELTANPADIVCIDAFSDLYEGSLNESNRVRAFLNQYSQLAQKHKCLMLFLHHCGKGRENELPSKNNLLGSQGIEAKMRLVMELRCDNMDKNLKHLCIVKGNYLPKEYKHESFQLLFSENMTFENTGERIPFESLVKEDDAMRKKYETIKTFQAQGVINTDEIAKQMGYSHRSSITRILNKYEKTLSVASPLQVATESNETMQQKKTDTELPY